MSYVHSVNLPKLTPKKSQQTNAREAMSDGFNHEVNNNSFMMMEDELIMNQPTHESDERSGDTAQSVKRTRQNTIFAPQSMDYIFDIGATPQSPISNHPTTPVFAVESPTTPPAMDIQATPFNEPLTGMHQTHSTSILPHLSMPSLPTLPLPNPMKALSRINVRLPLKKKKKKKNDDDGTNKSKSGPRRIIINDIKENMKVRVAKLFKFGQPDSLIGQQEIEVKTWQTPLFKSNKISTTQYSWWNYIPFDFLPRNLFYQYIYQLHNWYFLIVMIFSLIPGVSPVNPVSSVLPVVFILGVNLLKDFVEDLRRYISDRTANNRVINVVRDGQRMSVKTGSLKVGDIVHLKSEDVVPADILILYASNKGNKCYIETSQLDGEANMKPRFGRSSTAYLNTDEDVSRLTGFISCNAPVKDLDKVEGTIKFHTPQGEEVVETIGPENVVFKGCTIKNTSDAYGVVLYTGMESKVMLNTAKRKKKRSFIDTRVNMILLILVFLHQILVIIFTILSSIYQYQWNMKSFYIEPMGQDTENQVNFKFVLYSYFTNFILLNLLIPMSLFVSLQFIKEIQAFFMKKDLKLYYEKDDIPMNVGSADLNADLSQIDIVFSDKTGTLTNNTMNFKKLGIGSLITHNEDTDDNKGLIGRKLFGEIPFVPDNLTEDLRHRYLAMQYMLNLVLNNEIIVENGTYSGESPDEVCLVQTAKDNGFELKSQTDSEVVVKINGVTHTFPKIQTIKFTADRKRMSVLATFPRSFLTQFTWFRPGDIDITDSSVTDDMIPSCCFMKGADSFVIPWLAKSIEDSDVDVEADLAAAQKYLDEFATEGLRTLLLAHRVLVTEDARKWKERYTQASGVTSDSRVRQRRMDKVAAEVEEEMELCGATAIEDELQENVADTINFLLEAGIQFWVLTGDKRQTAKNVAQLAGIIKPSTHTKPTHVVDVELDSHPDPTVEYNNAVKFMNEALVDVTKIFVQDQTADICLVMNGSVVGVLERNTAGEIANLFKQISSKCKTVIVCRAIPAHKAAVVKAVKKMFGKNGLGIGDGANDVSMIQAAKVGVGISGKEGSQAVNAADYALPRFFHLKRLLAVHGRYSLTRSALFVQYSFYKNLILTFLQFFFGFYCAFSGTTLIDSWVLTLYNLVFTLLPPFVLGIFEKDVDDVTLEKWPSLYKNLKEDKFGFGQSLTLYSLTVWVAEALYHSAIIFFVTLYFCDPEALKGYQSDGFWVVSVIISVNLFIVVNLKVALEMNYFTILNHLSIWLSVILFFVFLFIYSAFKLVSGSSAMYYVVYKIFGNGRFYLITLLVVVLSLIPDVCLKALKKSYFASEWEKRKRERLKEKRRIRREARKAKQLERKQKNSGGKYMSPLESYSDSTTMTDLQDDHDYFETDEELKDM